MDPKDEINDGNEHLRALQTALDAFEKVRPHDRSPQDRFFAICITDLEKLIAVAAVYCTL